MVNTHHSTIKYKQGIIPLFSNIYSFRQEVEVSEFSLTGRDLDATIQYTNVGKAGISKASSIPRGVMGLIDDWIDFCSLVDSGKYRESIGLYYRLKRFLNR